VGQVARGMPYGTTRRARKKGTEETFQIIMAEKFQN